MSENQPTTPVRAGDMISRAIFGGFWSLVCLGSLVAAASGISGGHPGLFFGGLVVAILAGLYARYIFRGGRFRILFW